MYATNQWQPLVVKRVALEDGPVVVVGRPEPVVGLVDGAVRDRRLALGADREPRCLALAVLLVVDRAVGLAAGPREGDGAGQEAPGAGRGFRPGEPEPAVEGQGVQGRVPGRLVTGAGEPVEQSRRDDAVQRMARSQRSLRLRSLCLRRYGGGGCAEKYAWATTVVMLYMVIEKYRHGPG